MSHNQDVKVVLWTRRGEALGEALKKLREKSVVMSSQDKNDQDSSTYDSSNDQSTVFVEQPA